MDTSTLVKQMDSMVCAGQILEAIDQFFAGNADTIEVGGALTKTKNEKLGNIKDFLGSIQKVNGITLHHAAATGNVSFSEYTFDFDMKDGSKILWHEVIRRVWQDGKIVHEQYFQS